MITTPDKIKDMLYMIGNEFLLTSIKNNGKFYLPKDMQYGELKVFNEKTENYKDLKEQLLLYSIDEQKAILGNVASIFVANNKKANIFRSANNIKEIFIAISPTWKGWTGEYNSPYIFFQKNDSCLDSVLNRGTELLDPQCIDDWIFTENIDPIFRTFTPQEYEDDDEDDNDHNTYCTTIESDEKKVVDSVDSYDCTESILNKLNLSNAHNILSELFLIEDEQEFERLRMNLLNFAQTLGYNLNVFHNQYSTEN